MGAWTKNKVDSSLINKGQEYAKGDNVPLDQLNAITNNSFYAVNKADEALEKANSAFENNGTVVSVSGSTAPTLSFDSDPQTQISDINGKILDLQLKDSSLENTFSYYALKNLSNVTYPKIFADGEVYSGAGDRVVESYISSDGNTWYRKWASGWKECGGIVTGFVNYLRDVALPIEFSNTNYSIMLTPDGRGGGEDTYSCWVLNYGDYITSTNRFAIRNRANTPAVYYECKGY